MASRRHLFSSESVTEGHPDKMADQISDAILDAMLTDDDDARVACETLVTTGLVVIAGEITTTAQVNLEQVARDTVRTIGYTDKAHGFDAASCAVQVAVDPQSRDIAMGVDTGGAGDQGLMFGYACDETEELMPLPIMIAHGLTRRLADVRHAGTLDWLRPDGKSQVVVQYEDGVPKSVRAVVLSSQHAPEIATGELREALRVHVIAPTLEAFGLDARDATLHINPTGRFVTGGPEGDAGLTGRKIIVDTYGGTARHGGGAFSGKDPSKVDRSAAYAARWVAKHLVAAGFARRCEVQLAYAIGVAEPVSVMVDSFGTGAVPDEQLERAVRETFDLTPRGIVTALGLRSPVYRPTAAYGHFGRQPETLDVSGTPIRLFSWEDPSLLNEVSDAVHRAA